MKSSFNFTFSQRSRAKFAGPDSNKAVLVQVFLRFKIVIFNNNFFCMMCPFCSMAQVAGWIFTGEIIKLTNVVCLKKNWEKLNKHL